MQKYLSNLLPRLREYSQSLDKQELLIDQPWVLIDDNYNKQQYIFERDGKLIMALNGKVQYGSWRYIPSAKSLLIDRSTDSILLNQDFFTNGVCILRRDGFIEDPWLLINERIVPDLNIERYLKSLLPERKRFKRCQFKEGNYYFNDEHGNGMIVGSAVFDENDKKVTGIFELNDNSFVEIFDGRITRLFKKKTLNTDQGELIVEVDKSGIIYPGCPAYFSGSIANGTFKLLDEGPCAILIENGQVKKVKYNTLGVLVFVLIMIIAVLVFLYAQGLRF